MTCKAKEKHEKQRLADKQFHEDRIAYLSLAPVCWADGSKMSEHFRLVLLSGSRECLRLINEHGMSTNSAGAAYDQ